MIVIRRGRREEEEVRKKASSVVGPVEFRKVQEIFDENNFLYIHLSGDARALFDEARGVAGDVVLGARQALIARLLRVKYMPSGVYAGTFDAIDDLYGVRINEMNGVRVIDALQPWESRAYVFYDELPFSKIIRGSMLERISNAFDRAMWDVNGFCDIALKGYFKGAELSGKLSRGDKVVLLSTIAMLNDTLKLGGFEAPAATVYRPGKGFWMVKAGENKYDRPLLDGYIKIRFYDPGFKKFDEAVERHLEEIGKEASPSVNEYVKKIWKAVKPYVHAVIPAYYNFLGLDAEKEAPKAVARAVYRLASLYRDLSKAKTFNNPLKCPETRKVVEHLSRALSRIYMREPRNRDIMFTVAKMITELVPDEVEDFATSRVPYLITLIGEEIGSGFSMETVYEYTFDNKDYVEFSKALLGLGIVLAPRDAESLASKHPLYSAEQVHIPDEELGEGELEEKPGVVDALKKYIASQGYGSIYGIYTFFYALGIPVSRRFCNTGRRTSVNYTTTMNVKLFIEKPEALGLKHEVKLPGLEISLPSAGSVFFKAVDKVISTYIRLVHLEYYQRRQVKPTDPRIYQGVLYLFSDRDYVNGTPLDNIDELSVHTKLLDAIKEAVHNIMKAQMLDKKYEKAKQKYLKKGKVTRKLDAYIRQLVIIKNRLEKIGDEIIQMATLYNPRYIAVLSKRSENIYRVLLAELEGEKRPAEPGTGREEGGGGGRPFYPHSIEDMLSRLRRLSEVLSTASTIKEFHAYTQKQILYRTYNWDGISEGFRNFLIQAEELRRREEHVKREEKKKEKKEEEETTKPPKPLAQPRPDRETPEPRQEETRHEKQEEHPQPQKPETTKTEKQTPETKTTTNTTYQEEQTTTGEGREDRSN